MAYNNNYKNNNQNDISEEEKKQIALRKAENFKTLKNLLRGGTLAKRFKDMLGERAPQFISSVINVTSSTDQLQACDPNSVIQAALIAATLDLPINPNLGFAAIVPYKVKGEDKAQFQMMAKGFIQLAIRTGQYKHMNYSAVYEDELLEYNPIFGECRFVSDFTNCKQRASGQDNKIVGYFAYFETLDGYRHELYMSKSEIENHAKKYSSAYKYDLKRRYSTSVWTTNFDAMAKKTVIKLLLSKWALLSIGTNPTAHKGITDGVIADQQVFDLVNPETGEYEGMYLDNPKRNELPDGEVKALEAPDNKNKVVDAFAVQEQKEKVEVKVENPQQEEPKAEQIEMKETDDGFAEDYEAFDAQFESDDFMDELGEPELPFD